MIPKDLLEDYFIDQEDGLKKLLTWFLNLVMQFEAMEQIDAEPYQRVGSRKAYRNGYKERSLKTRVGELTLKKPQFREIPFQTKVFDRYSRVERALINAVIESYLQGVSTRRVQDIVSRLGIEELSASSVSRIAKELDEKVEEFLKRPIEHPVPYLFVDASYFKVRTNSRYVTKAFLIVTGIRDDGYREILGARIADGEDELFWSGLFQDLTDRGLSGVKLVISDGVNGGLKVSNSGGIKLSTCQSLGLKTRGHVDDRCGGVPHVARFVQPRSEHQRDRQTDWTQPCNGAKASEFSDSPYAQEEIQEAKQTGWSQGIHNR